MGRYCRSRPLLFSHVPRCQGQCGSQRYTATPVRAVSSLRRDSSLPCSWVRLCRIGAAIESSRGGRGIDHLDQQRQAAGALHQHADRGQVARALDEVATLVRDTCRAPIAKSDSPTFEVTTTPQPSNTVRWSASTRLIFRLTRARSASCPADGRRSHRRWRTFFIAASTRVTWTRRLCSAEACRCATPIAADDRRCEPVTERAGIQRSSVVLRRACRPRASHPIAANPASNIAQLEGSGIAATADTCAAITS